MANSAQANSATNLVPTAVPVFISTEAQDEARKGVVSKFLRCLNFGDMNGLAKVIRENCRETCFLVSPDLFEPIMGKGDVMMLFSLLFEAYPDGVWNIGTLVCSKDGTNTISCLYRFTGTGVFCHSINTLFLQIRAHSIQNPVTENHEEFQNIINTNRMVNEVAEFCHPVPSVPPPPPVSRPLSGGYSSGPLPSPGPAAVPAAVVPQLSFAKFGGSPPAALGKSVQSQQQQASLTNAHLASVPGMPHVKLNNSFNIPSVPTSSSTSSAPLSSSAKSLSSSSHGSVLAREYRKQLSSPQGSFSDNGTPRNLLTDSPSHSTEMASSLSLSLDHSSDDNNDNAISIPRRRGSIKLETVIAPALLPRTNSSNNSSFYGPSSGAVSLSSPRSGSDVFLDLTDVTSDRSSVIAIPRRTASIKDLGGSTHGAAGGAGGGIQHSAYLLGPSVGAAAPHVPHHSTAAPPPPPVVVSHAANTKVLENNVLKNGPVTQRRRIEFVFDEWNSIERIVITNQ